MALCQVSWQDLECRLLEETCYEPEMVETVAESGLLERETVSLKELE